MPLNLRTVYVCHYMLVLTYISTLNKMNLLNISFHRAYILRLKKCIKCIIFHLTEKYK